MLGKRCATTSLAIRFILELLNTRTTDTESVPVMFSLGSWNPATTSLRDWLTDQMVRDYPGLAALDHSGASLARALVDDGRILPVLDGFDEIAAGLRRAALEALNAITTPLVVTSRPDEYAAAVASTDVLTAAAGIELDDLSLADLTDYLPRTTRKMTANSGHTAAAWDALLACLRDQPGIPASRNLAAVLSTPLMVALARTIYSDTPEHDPAALLDPIPVT
ncbi:hypothetical protein [Kitasatospora sp. NPDC093558]|uniref:hypothetical protein n=1 Tax=Kitasatospora sp. NPDC093558 TaxID=3155201 RepID=UPI003433C52A